LTTDSPKASISITGVNTSNDNPLLTVTTAGTSGTAIQASATNAYGTAVYATSVSGTGVYAMTNDGTAVQGFGRNLNSSGGYFSGSKYGVIASGEDAAIYAETLFGKAFRFQQMHGTSTNNVTVIGEFKKTPISVVPADGYGMALDYILSTPANERQAGREVFKWSVADDANRSSSYDFYLTNVGAAQRKYSIDANGQFTFDGYAAAGFETTDSNFLTAVFSPDGKLYARRGSGGSGGAASQRQTYALTQTVTVANTIDETLIAGSGEGSLIIPATAWRIGKTYRVKIHLLYSTDPTNPTSITARLKLGSTTIAASSTFLGASRNNMQWTGEVEFTCRATGVNGSVIAMGTRMNDNNTGTFSNGSVASNIDLTAPLPVNVTLQMNDSSPGNVFNVYMLEFEEIN
jgi:hypothetical protein